MVTSSWNQPRPCSGLLEECGSETGGSLSYTFQSWKIPESTTVEPKWRWTSCSQFKASWIPTASTALGTWCCLSLGTQISFLTSGDSFRISLPGGPGYICPTDRSSKAGKGPPGETGKPTPAPNTKRFPLLEDTVHTAPGTPVL